MRSLARVRGRGLLTHRGERQYRSRLEILRDFLEATRTAGKKTRIIGLANLNPSSFDFYRDFCVNLQLVEEIPGGYRLTARADKVLAAIERVVHRGAELDSALSELQRNVSRSGASATRSGGAMRWVSKLAWQEVVESALQPPPTTANGKEPVVSVDFPGDGQMGWIASTSGGRAAPSHLPSLGSPNLTDELRRRLPRPRSRNGNSP